MELQGARVLVTAGSRRLGAEIAVDLAAGGADVAITYRTSPRDADETLARIRAHGVAGHAVQADLADATSAAGCVHAAAELLDGLDGVVHCASAGFRGTDLADLT